MDFAEGSCLIEMGRTRVLAAVSSQPFRPQWMKGEARGWVTAEYGMLPRSTHERTSRDQVRLGGRTQEIQRLIGRSLRAVTDLDALGEQTLVVDCDVIQADGGTRTAAVTAGYLALRDALAAQVREGRLERLPLTDLVVGVSAGIVRGELRLDLCYEEDSQAELDLNVVGTASGKLVEVQGTGEGRPFSVEELEGVLSLARAGLRQLVSIVEQELAGENLGF